MHSENKEMCSMRGISLFGTHDIGVAAYTVSEGNLYGILLSSQYHWKTMHSGLQA